MVSTQSHEFQPFRLQQPLYDGNPQMGAIHFEKVRWQIAKSPPDSDFVDIALVITNSGRGPSRVSVFNAVFESCLLQHTQQACADLLETTPRQSD